VEDLKNYGPLRFLIGTWQSDYQGENKAPDPDRKEENTKFKQTITFTPIGETTNHEQSFYVLDYQNEAWEEGDDSGPFHRENGYFYYDLERKMIVKGFSIPRAQSVLAGGKSGQDDLTFALSAKRGSTSFGIVSNPFLEEEFTTLSYDVTFKVVEGKTLSYEESTKLKLKGQEQIFDHTEKNTLKKIK